jgi:hypothetical protein
MLLQSQTLIQIRFQSPFEVFQSCSQLTLDCITAKFVHRPEDTAMRLIPIGRVVVFGIDVSIGSSLAGRHSPVILRADASGHVTAFVWGAGRNMVCSTLAGAMKAHISWAIVEKGEIRMYRITMATTGLNAL